MTTIFESYFFPFASKNQYLKAKGENEFLKKHYDSNSSMFDVAD